MLGRNLFYSYVYIMLPCSAALVESFYILIMITIKSIMKTKVRNIPFWNIHRTRK